MKKVLPALVLMGFSVVLFMPLIVSAAASQGQIECCTLKRDMTGVITNDTTQYPAGAVVGPAGGNCVGSNGQAINIGTQTSNWGALCLMNTIFSVTDWIFVILVAIAAIMVLMGAWRLLLSGGSPDKIDEGRKYIIYAAVGLAVGFLAKAIPSLVRMMIGA